MPPNLNVNADKAVTAAASASGTTDVQAAPAAAHRRLMGYSIRESAGSAAVATVNIRNGVADTAPIVAQLELAADAERTMWFGPNGIDCANGIFIEKVAGTTTVVVYYMDHKQRSF